MNDCDFKYTVGLKQNAHTGIDLILPILPKLKDIDHKSIKQNYVILAIYFLILCYSYVLSQVIVSVTF